MKQGDRVKCIDNTNHNYLVDDVKGEYDLTVGKEYTVEESAHPNIRVVSDSGHKKIYPKSIFRTVQELRDKKIDSIIN